MIQSLIGVVTFRNKHQIDITIGPIECGLYTPDASLFRVGTAQRIFIYTHWLQETGPSFYGFATELDKTVFTLIISCAGIGPKIGLAVLADLGSERFIQAIQSGDEKSLSSVSGIGAKKAEQMIFQLKGKVAKLLESGLVVGASQQLMDWNLLSQALESLNYSRTEIARAITHLRETSADQSLPFDQLMRRALTFFSQRSAS